MIHCQLNMFTKTRRSSYDILIEHYEVKKKEDIFVDGLMGRWEDLYNMHLEQKGTFLFHADLTTRLHHLKLTDSLRT